MHLVTITWRPEWRRPAGPEILPSENHGMMGYEVDRWYLICSLLPSNYILALHISS